MSFVMLDDAPDTEQLLGRIVEKLYLLTEEVKAIRTDVDDLKRLKDRTLGMVMAMGSLLTGFALLVDWFFHVYGHLILNK